MARHALHFTTLLALCLLPLVSACEDDPTEPDLDVSELEVVPRQMTLPVGSSAQLLLFRDGTEVATDAVTWESADPHIVVVSEDGMIRTQARGEAQIEALYAGRRASAVINSGHEVNR